MTNPKAVLGTFSDAKLIKSRSVLQIVIEIPIEQADDAMKALGGFPLPAQERWVGVALAPKDREARSSAVEPSAHNGLVAGSNPAAPTAQKERRPFGELELSAQAAIRCGDADFIDFMAKKYDADLLIKPNEIAKVLRYVLCVESRAELNIDHTAANRWHSLERDFQGWLTDKRYADARR